MTNFPVTIQPSFPTSDDIREQLERIISSEDFIVPDRGRRFLRFLVEETLAGRSQYLKAFTLAQSIFNRNDSFDAQSDPCVRIAAHQLRLAIERYYLTAGFADDVVITIPKGRYIPIFEARVAKDGAVTSMGGVEASLPEPPKREGRLIRWIMIGASMIVLAAVVFASFAERKNSAIKLSANGGRPTIIVERFRNLGQSIVPDEVSRGLTDEIVVNLSRFKELDVIVPADISDANVDPTYLLQGSVQFQNRQMRTTARLVRKTDGVVVWSANYDVDTEGRRMLDVEAAIARSIATAIASPFRKITDPSL